MQPLEQKSKRDRVQYLMSTATLTPAVKRLMEDEGFPTTRFLQSSDAHKSLPNMKHVMIDTKGTDKVRHRHNGSQAYVYIYIRHAPDDMLAGIWLEYNVLVRHEWYEKVMTPPNTHDLPPRAPVPTGADAH